MFEDEVGDLELAIIVSEIEAHYQSQTQAVIVVTHTFPQVGLIMHV